MQLSVKAGRAATVANGKKNLRETETCAIAVKLNDGKLMQWKENEAKKINKIKSTSASMMFGTFVEGRGNVWYHSVEILFGLPLCYSDNRGKRC